MREWIATIEATAESRNDDIRTIPFPLTVIARRFIAEAIHKTVNISKNAESQKQCR